MLKVDPNKLKQRLEEQQKKAAFKGKKDPKDYDFVRVENPGTYMMRPVIYPHNQDSDSNPLCERSYHYSIGSQRVFYCPRENDGLKCHVCDFIFTQLKEINDKKLPVEEAKELKKPWREKMPTYTVFLPVLIRTREAEGPKFLRITSRRDKLSERHQEIYDWLLGKEDPDHMNLFDPNLGYDLMVTYEEVDEKRKAFFNGAKVAFKKWKKSEKSSKFSNNKNDYEEFMKNIKNIDDLYPPKTTEQSLELLQAWGAAEGINQNSNPGTAIAGKPQETDSETTNEVDSADLESKLASLGL